MTIFREDDLIDDRSFTAKSLAGAAHTDNLDHAKLAEQLAELSLRSPGKVNIAVFGPWGAGKSSLAALMRQSLSKEIWKKRVNVATFDAWQFAGDSFAVNFVSEVAREIGLPAQRKIERSLFQSRKTVSLPLELHRLPAGARITILVLLLVAVFIALPLFWTIRTQDWAWGWTDADLTAWGANISSWLAFGISGSLLLVVATVGLELTRASIEESEPSHTTQFRKLFDQVIKDSKLDKLVVFIDELDRCSPGQLMKTLEGLRTFLGHERVVFVAAFDRDAVASTIVIRRKQELEAGDADTPYYLTAGEYLDKIFQFQLSLPPQSSHTMRRFSLALVSDRGGVWGELAELNQLESVVSLLSPAHIRSPRRAKVLLNDFAVNARAFEQLVGKEWVDRAAEIAVWTVLQTEFPHLAADMTTEPDLPRYLLDQDEEPNREAFREMVIRYRSQKPALDATPQATTASVGKRQHADLLVYLERTRSLRVPLPASDLIWRTKSRAFEPFDDQGLVDVLVRAPDRTIRSTLVELSAASAADIGRAIAFLGRTVEEEFVSEARLVAVVMGELADIHPVAAAAHDHLLSSTWRRIAAIDARWCTSAAARGYARAIARTESTSQIARFAAAVLDEIDENSGVIAALLDSVPRERWGENWSTVLEAVPRDMLNGFGSLKVVLQKEKARSSGVLSPALKLAVVDALSIPEPAETQPAYSTTQARQAAADETARLRDEVTSKRERVAANLGELVEIWPTLEGHGHPRRWLLSLLRALEASIPTAAELHDELISRNGDDQTANDSAHLILDALVELPRGAERWTLTGVPSEPSNMVGAAVNALLPETVGIVDGSATQRIDEIGAAFGQLGEAPSKITWLGSLIEGSPEDSEQYVLGLRSIQRRFGSEEALQLQVKLVAGIATRTDVNNADKILLARLLDPSATLKVAETLSNMVRRLDAAQAHATASFLLELSAELKRQGTE